jgi:hypothetical protein
VGLLSLPGIGDAEKFSSVLLRTPVAILALAGLALALIVLLALLVLRLAILVALLPLLVLALLALTAWVGILLTIAGVVRHWDWLLVLGCTRTDVRKETIPTRLSRSLREGDHSVRLQRDFAENAHGISAELKSRAPAHFHSFLCIARGAPEQASAKQP